MKIHVTLKEEFHNEETIKKVIAAGKMTNVNEARARDFGVISGDAPTGVEDALLALDEVEDVSRDGEQSTR